MEIVLFEPEIPANTGNISRTCAVTGTPLHLIEPLGFSLADRYLKRAGLDYWDKLNLHIHGSFADFLAANPGAELYLFSTKAKKNYAEISYKANDFLVFGPETRGLSQSILEGGYGTAVRIPMGKEIRSLNLSNSVAIGLYEALRQLDFPNLR
ncbi:MAG: tRNA (uridine(34)/cytosine(34)/5-carboxymethylaminomethyluridine(34)-2'-O)-methyltransferase TrmL [Bacillota bacterium]|nr:tRNA (uridine(34)/cytosine(34)/5-carboxymethylaminomethyluridine(34)-2'-O)-methyltransferase TrmL [Bacillota bacterium]